MRSLDIFILDEMIEQYARCNPLPNPENKLSFQLQAEAGMVESLLTELKALRQRCNLYEMRIIHLNQDVNSLNNKIVDLEKK